MKSYVGAPDFTELHRLIEKLLAEAWAYNAKGRFH